MRIFLDLRSIRKNMTGVGSASLLVLKALIRHGSDHEFHCMFLKGERPDESYPPNFIPMETDADYEKHPSGEWWLNVTLPEILNRLKIDVLHGTSFLIPWRKTRFRKIVTIHDLISYKYPVGYPFAFRNYIKSAIRFSARNADRVIVSSENTGNDLHELLGISEDKIDRVPCYCFDFFKPLSEEETSRSRKLLNLPERFILNVGTLESRKNQTTLLRAFEILKRNTNLPHKLILIGQEGYRSNEILSEMEKSAFASEIQHIKGLSQSGMVPYYACADLFVFPSHYEGFGLPVLEAMACGTPVVAAHTSSLPEVAGEAGIFFSPPGSVENLAKIMMELVTASKRLGSLRNKSLEQAARFSGEKTAKLLLSCYERMEHDSRRKDEI